MDGLLGDMPGAARFIFAFVLVLGLIIAGAYLWRRFGAGPLATVGPRGRQPRLAVIDATAIDARRRLVLVRRDNTEHLLMIGGPTDLVVEPNIVRAIASRDLRAGAGAGTADLRHPMPLDAPGMAPAYEQALRAVRAAEPDANLALDSDVWGDAAELPLPTPLENIPRSERAEPAMRMAPHGGAPRLAPGADGHDTSATAMLPPMPPAMPPEPPLRSPAGLGSPAAPAIPEPRRAAMTPPPIPEPVAPEPRRMWAPPVPPPVPPPTPAYEPVFQTPPPAEPRRAAAQRMAARAADVMPEPETQWTPPPKAAAAAEPPPRSPVFQLTQAPKRSEPPPVPQSDESNLAEMAHRLEAALRRPTKPVEPGAPGQAAPAAAAAQARPAARPEITAARAARLAAQAEPAAAPPSAMPPARAAEPRARRQGGACPPGSARPQGSARRQGGACPQGSARRQGSARPIRQGRAGPAVRKP